VPYRTAQNVIAGVVATFADVSALKATADRLARRERQQGAVAALGEAATGTATAIAALLDRAVESVAEHLDVPLVKVLELRPGREELFLRAGVGWHAGLVGSALVGADRGSQAGHTLRSQAPVIVADLATETRFSGPALLLDHGVVSGVSVTIGPVDAPWGVLGAHATTRRDFSIDDVNFLQAVSNVLWATIERQRVARAYRIAAERFELAVGVGGLATWEWDIATGETVWSDGHYTMFGYRTDEVDSTVDIWRDRVHPDDLPRANAAIASALAGDGHYVCEYRVIPAPGVERWVEGRGRTIFGPAGDPARMFGVVIDITERKRGEERQTVLLNELDHRVRNILANVTALARQTQGRATSVAAYVADLTGRLGAIARAHTLLSETRWAGASLRTLVEEELAPFRGSGRITVTGSDVMLAPDDAQLFAMALHELATNASRHGALHSGDGALDVRWAVETVDREEKLAVDWRETVLTPVEAPRTEGFGALVLSRLLPMQTGGVISLDWRPEGLACRLLVARDRVRLEPETGTAGGGAQQGDLASLAGLRVLIVEDSMLTALDIEAMLRAEGATIAGIAGTLDEAEARLARGGIDAALLDRNLGGTLVDDFARTLDRLGVPFVFMTGYGAATIPPDLRGKPVLGKPFETAALTTALAAVRAR
jgi:PAS domain S-box-containing protein